MIDDGVVVTGYGLITALGHDIESHVQAFLHHKTGIKKYDHTGFPLGLVQFSNQELIDLLQLPAQTYSRTFLLAYFAIKAALHSANLSVGQISNSACISGSSVGGMDTGEKFYYQMRKAHQIQTNLLQVHDIGQVAQAVSILLGLKGFVTTISTACSSAANAILMGAKLIQTQRASVAIVGGADALCQFTIAGFHSLKILSEEQNQPFDQQRKGLNLGEGAGYLILESRRHAEARGAKIRAKLTGFANTCDAFHQTASSPDGQGAFLSMTQALIKAKNPDIQYINTHGTATVNNDLSESIAIKRVFADKVPAFSSTKAMTGHTLAASGGIESIFSVLALENQLLLPNLFFQTPMQETGLIPVTQATSAQINAVLMNSFGFGGNNTSLVFERS